MTPRQIKYTELRISGMRPTSAARAAGYAMASAKKAANKLEKNPAVAAAIAAAAPPASQSSTSPTPYETAEQYLAAVMCGAEPPDPVRVSAARCLIQYQAGRQRRPLPAALSPTKSAELEQAADEAALLEAWERETAEIFARFNR